VRLYDPELITRFEEHAREELYRWSPEPPDIDDLISYAERFDLRDLVEKLELVAKETSEQADIEDERSRERAALLRDTVADSDVDLERMFSRLAIDAK
jgi:hypothetical protein